MTILILANNDGGLYGFRRELIEALIEEGHTVVASVPDGLYIEKLRNLGCELDICDSLERHGTNPLKELGLIHYYKKLLRRIRPDIVFTYTIKPNVYGGWLCGKMHIPYVVNITGLGTAVEKGGLMQCAMLILYRQGVKHAQKVFFQNKENQAFMLQHHVVTGAYELIPGSGVNTERFPLLDYPDEDQKIRFLFISRIMKEKGIEQYLQMAKIIKVKYPYTEFHICGFCEKEYQGELDKCCEDGVVIYHGEIQNVSDFLKSIHCVVHPTFYPEGLSNVLLEACSSGRPIITTNRAGCREVVDDGVNGYMVPQKDTQRLIEAVEKFLQLTDAERRRMGLVARKKVERRFDRRIVIEKYLEEVDAMKGTRT